MMNMLAEPRRLRPIRIGISACLPGEPVPLDGGHKRDAFLTETFGRFVEWVPVCPEVECGFGTPRMRLVRIEQGPRLPTVKTGMALTERMERFSRSRVSALVRLIRHHMRTLDVTYLAGQTYLEPHP